MTLTARNPCQDWNLVGEKYLNPDPYETGSDRSDNENMYVGVDNDTTRTTGYTPIQHKRSYSHNDRFGSAHAAGLNMLSCDGTVQFTFPTTSPTMTAPSCTGGA